MLVLSIRKQTAVKVGDVVFHNLENHSIKVGIEAPAAVGILRSDAVRREVPVRESESQSLTQGG